MVIQNNLGSRPAPEFSRTPKHEINRDKGVKESHSVKSVFGEDSASIGPSLPEELTSNNNRHSKYNTAFPPPPLSTSDFFVVEDKNSSPNLIRSSFYVVPYDRALHEIVDIPFGIIISPFCTSHIFSDSKPDTCNNCGTYVSPFTEHNPSGFICHLCNSRNGHASKILASSTDFLISEGSPPPHLFCIEWNETTVQNNHVLNSLNALKRVISSDDYIEIFPNIAIVLFNDKEAYYITDEINVIQNEGVVLGLTGVSPSNICIELCSQITPTSNSPGVGALLRIGLIARRGGMSVLHYNPIDVSSVRNAIFYRAIYEISMSPIFYECEFVVRTSDSLRKVDVYAASEVNSLHRFICPIMRHNQCTTVSFNIDETLKDNQSVFVQVEVLYKDGFGSYRCCILNHEYKASIRLSTIISGITVDSAFAMLVKDCIWVKDGQARIQKKLISCLKSYRESYSRNVSSGQLVLPESIKILPVLVSAFIKNNIWLLKNTSYEFKSIVQKLQCMKPDEILCFFYPRILDFSSYIIDGSKNYVRATRKSLSTGCYIILSNPPIVVSDLDTINYLKTSPEEQIHFKNLCIEDPIFRTPDHVDVVSKLVEDPLNGFKSYEDYLVEIHHLIKK